MRSLDQRNRGREVVRPEGSVSANPIRLIDDPEYVQGQIAALQALILGLAQQLSKEEFREQSLARLEVLKTALLPTAASDVRLVAIEHAEDWIRKVTA